MTEDYNGRTKSLALTIFIQVLVHIRSTTRLDLQRSTIHKRLMDDTLFLMAII